MKFKKIYDPIIFNNELESIDREKYLIATVYFESSPDYGDFVDHLALVQRAGLQGATGSWVDIKGETDLVRSRLCFKIVGFYQIPQIDRLKRAVVQFAYPIEAWKPNVPSMMLSPLGNILFFPGKVKCLNVAFPESLAKEFKGPKFGVEGIRRELGVKDRPLLLSIAKPKMGMTPEETARQAYESVIGGADMYKDDEMNTETWNCSFEDRLSAVLEALDRAQEETGRKAIYFITATDEVDKLCEKAEKACQMGAKGILLPYSIGWSALRVVAEDPSVKIPIFFHPSHAGAILDRVSYTVFAKFSRLCGADVMITPTEWGALPIVPLEEAVRSVQVCLAPFYHIRSSFPGPGGGMYPGLVPTLMEEMGNDIVIMAGGGIHGHPQGTIAGAKAFRQAIDAVMQGIPLSEAAKDKPELKTAIEVWGIFKRPVFPYDGLYPKYPPKLPESAE